MRVVARQPVGELSGPVGRGVVHDQDRVVGRRAATARPARRARAARGSPARCRSAGRPTRSPGSALSSIAAVSRLYVLRHDERRDRGRDGRARRPLRAGRGRRSTGWSPTARPPSRSATRRCPSRSSPARAARPSCATSGRRSRRRSGALLETGDIPAAVKLRSKFPGELVRFTRLPGLGAKTARRIHDELGISTLEELRARRRAGAPALGARGSGRRRSRTSPARWPSSRRRGRPSGCCCRPCSRSASRSSSTCAPTRRRTAWRSRAARAA